MTQTLLRPARAPLLPRRTAASSSPWGLLEDGALIAVKVVTIGLLLVCLPVLLVWATDARAGAGAAEALRTAGQLWLVAHGASLEVPGGDVALTPLGLLALPLALLVRAGSTCSRKRRTPSVRDVGRLAVAAAVPYAVLAGLVAVVSATDDVRAGPFQALLGGFAVALVGVGAGGLRPNQLWRAGWLWLPARARRLVCAATAATAVLAGSGALLTGTALAFHGSRAADLAGTGAPGPVGGVALLVLGLSLVPNAVVWGASWLAGPGFAVGVGTAVGPFGHQLGPVPALPLLAALPGAGVPGWAGALALLVPLAAGGLAGRVVQRDLPDVAAGRLAAEAALAGPAAGGVWVVLAWLSGGPVGGQRLTEVGPSVWAVGLAIAASVALGSTLSALAHRHRAA